MSIMGARASSNLSAKGKALSVTFAQRPPRWIARAILSAKDDLAIFAHSTAMLKKLEKIIAMPRLRVRLLGSSVVRKSELRARPSSDANAILASERPRGGKSAVPGRHNEFILQTPDAATPRNRRAARANAGEPQSLVQLQLAQAQFLASRDGRTMVTPQGPADQQAAAKPKVNFVARRGSTTVQPPCRVTTRIEQNAEHSAGRLRGATASGAAHAAEFRANPGGVTKVTRGSALPPSVPGYAFGPLTGGVSALRRPDWAFGGLARISAAKRQKSTAPAAWERIMAQNAGSVVNKMHDAPFSEVGATRGRPTGANSPAAEQPAAAPLGEAAVSGELYLDGNLLGRWMEQRLAQVAARPPCSGSAFDPTRSRLPTGAMIGV
jgi:hypothetical protein